MESLWTLSRATEFCKSNNTGTFMFISEVAMRPMRPMRMSFSPADFVLLFRSPVTENQRCNLSDMTDLEISFSRYHRSQTVILVKVYIFLKA